MHADGNVYMKYKNSDIGPRVWKQIVATPVWIPPDGTPAKDLLTTQGAGSQGRAGDASSTRT